ncbi:protein lifeguard 2-like [Polyodon spathula]|uniref:protein lifeguard 2-like n=1 Tax=Polyodon spathula TaxID=7913 RepID=UPI001B7E0C3E|nr:protein lifeguard 2-like [Polyodon spathula]
MTQGKITVVNKTANGSEGGGGAAPPPPSYEEAISGENKTGVSHPPGPPPIVPVHPSWAFVDPNSSPSYSNAGYPGDGEMLTEFSWDDKNIRRVFIRKVKTATPPGQCSQGCVPSKPVPAGTKPHCRTHPETQAKRGSSLSYW